MIHMLTGPCGRALFLFGVFVRWGGAHRRPTDDFICFLFLLKVTNSSEEEGALDLLHRSVAEANLMMGGRGWFDLWTVWTLQGNLRVLLGGTETMSSSVDGEVSTGVSAPCLLS